MDECETELSNLENVQHKLTAEKDMVERKQAELRELTIKEQQLSRQESSAEEKLSRFHHQVATKRNALNTKLDKMRVEWEKSGQDRSSLQEQLDKYDEVIGETRQKV